MQHATSGNHLPATPSPARFFIGLLGCEKTSPDGLDDLGITPLRQDPANSELTFAAPLFLRFENRQNLGKDKVADFIKTTLFNIMRLEH